MADPDLPSRVTSSDVSKLAKAATERSRQAMDESRQARDEMRRVAAEVADVETQVARTLRLAATTASDGGRSVDARRLRGKAEEAEGFAEHERVQSRADELPPR